MTKEIKTSRFWPCTMRYQGVLCNGTAILEDDKYTCDACGWQWNEHGEPIIEGDTNV